MIEKGKMNYEKSKELFLKHKDILKPKFCYNNILELVDNFPSEFYQDKQLIAYGYLGIPNFNFVRHCYIVTKDNIILDPTILALFENEDDFIIRESIYYTFAKISYSNYMTIAFKSNRFEPDLKMFLKESEFEFYNYAKENLIDIHHESYDLYLKEFMK
jgi:hypothetical protein